ncbi:hypothetical protein N658DRAFT_513572 [Parathielavia hyrcaniae]|uniref:Copper homeostasis protein cutC homolog n=1 Tax=Parathielavia hyrcaniae TaxID=113614 RepID=A0AAN6Q716_9PEZI|nr:hypothetical protein N658DRAFT_513572 [Parathielavia hyrcaniae]
MAGSDRPLLEVPIFGPDDGPLAASLGASRLELNRAGSYALGGTTPTLAELSALLSSLTNNTSPHAPAPTNMNRPTIRIMIRPRGPPTTTTNTPQDFVYTSDEFSTMAFSIKEFVSSGLLSPEHGDGFVFGILRDDDSVGGGGGGGGGGGLGLDVERNRELVALATSRRESELGFECVLHRAVDDLLDGVGSESEVGKVMEEVRRCGFYGVLTSGGRGRAVDHVERLKSVVDVAGENGVEVIVGGGVRRGNVRELEGGIRGEGGPRDGVWFHSSCLGSEGSFDREEAEGLVKETSGMNMLVSRRRKPPEKRRI